MVWFLPVLLVVDSHCWLWFWRSRATACHRHSTYNFPAMHASQGDPLGVFQGSFGWIDFLVWVQQELLSTGGNFNNNIIINKWEFKKIFYNIFIKGKENAKGM